MSEQYTKRKNRVWLWATLAVVAFVGGALLGNAFNGSEPEPPAVLDAPTVTETRTPEATPEVTPPPAPLQDTQTLENTGYFTNQRLQQQVLDSIASVPDMVEQVASAVVGISNNITMMNNNYSLAPSEVTQASGSGVVISADGYIITNAHVVDGAETLYVIFENGENVEAALIGSDSRTDIALLKVDRTGLNHVRLGDSSTIRVGEFVVAIGNPLGDDLAGTVTMGIVSAVERQITDADGLSSSMIQTDAAINPGNSGGALLNLAGELIGMNTAKSTLSDSYYSTQYAEGIGFAIPVNDILPIINELKENGFVARPMLGVGNVSTVTQAQAQYNGVPVGVLCRMIYDGPAKEAGMKEMDIITAFNGSAISTYEELKQALDVCKVGDTVEVVVYRMSEQQSYTLKITLVSQQEINPVNS